MSQKDQQSVVPNPRWSAAASTSRSRRSSTRRSSSARSPRRSRTPSLYGLKEPESPHQYDATLGKTKIGPDYQTTRANFPSIVVKFYEQQIMNAGVGHMEWGPETTEIQLSPAPAKSQRDRADLYELDTVQFLFPGITEIKGDGIPKGAIVIQS